MANEVTSFEVQGNEYDVNPHLTFDSTPTVGSSNPVTSNGIALAVQSAAIGTDISVGRTAGTPIGYCSIAYGTDNTASGDYSIVFGQNNKSFSRSNIICGELNVATTYSANGENAIFGVGNSNNGYGCIISGTNNIVGLKIREITESSYPDYEHGDGLVYIGYVNPSTNKIYYDEQMTSEITIDRRSNNDQFYFVDKRTYNNQQPGDVYLYSRYIYQSGNVFTVKKLRPEYADFTNYCRSVPYKYMGPCYFDAANDKIYSDAEMEHQITNPYSLSNWALYFDVIDGSFIFFRGYGVRINNAPSWNRVKVYKGQQGDRLPNRRTNWGIYAYINRRPGDSTAYHVYSAPEMDDSQDITDTLIDGEVVCDMASGRCVLYCLNVNNRAICVVQNEALFNGANSYTALFGSGSITSDSAGSLIIGDNNDFSRTFLGSSLVNGWGNVIIGQMSTHGICTVGGLNNKISLPGNGINMIQMVGIDNSFEASLLSNGLNWASIVGENNKVGGYTSDDVQVLGNFNNAKDSSLSTTIGNYNTINFANGSTIIGRENSVTRYTGALAGYNPTITEVVDAKWQSNGTLLINNETYDLPINPSSTKNYPMNQLFRMIGRMRPTDSGYKGNQTKEIESVLGYCASSNGRTLIDIPNTNWFGADNPVNIFGNYNDYIRNIQGFYGYTDDRSSYNNFIVGSYNKLYASGTSYVGLIGDHLTFYGNAGSPSKKNKSIIYIGSYNSDSNAEGYINMATPQLIVGIGTSDNDRKNGFVVMKNGILLAPECPNTVSEATSGTYSDARKLVMTYGLVMDYVHNVSPGTTGKPGQVVVTLNASDWSNSEQTIDFSGVDDNSVVIIAPSGSPDLFYTDRIYLKSQGEGELTFGCLFAPAENVDVKVVYWT